MFILFFKVTDLLYFFSDIFLLFNRHKQSHWMLNYAYWKTTLVCRPCTTESPLYTHTYIYVYISSEHWLIFILLCVEGLLKMGLWARSEPCSEEFQRRKNFRKPWHIRLETYRRGIAEDKSYSTKERVSSWGFHLW